MPIVLKSRREIEMMRRAGQVANDILAKMESATRAGVSTMELDELAEEELARSNAVGLSKNYPTYKPGEGFPASTCISVNEEVVHGIPGPLVLKDGDVVTWTYTAVPSGGNATTSDLLRVDPVQPTQGDAVTLTGQVERDATVSIRNGPSLQAAKGAWTLKVPLADFGQTRATLVADDGAATQAVDLVLVRLASATFETKYTAYPAHEDGTDTVWFDPSVHASLPMYDGKSAPRADQYSVHDLMVDWTAQTGTAIEYGYSESFGFSVSKIDGVGQPVDAALPPYWCYKVDGATADFGISLQPLLPGQTVTWEYAGCM